MRLRTVALLLGLACARPGPPSADTATTASDAADAAFAAVQARGADVMGVDQSASTHVFEDLPDGGRIIYTANDTADATAIATIRAHLREVAAAFAAGDFSQPARVHGRDVPGTAELTARRSAVSYAATDRPAGAELRITTADAAALAAVRTFLQFQRDDHRAAGHEGHGAALDHEAHMKGTSRSGGKAP